MSSLKSILLENKKLLHDLARESIRHTAETGDKLPIENGKSESYSLPPLNPTLLKPAACFVTLESKGDLRGCAGIVVARKALIDQVAESAWFAAFKDTRFPPVRSDEIDELKLSISVLSPPEKMDILLEDELLELLKPGVDGLIIDDGVKSAIFLPEVWERLPDPKDFLAHLKTKAGIPLDMWAEGTQAYRFHSLKV